MKLRTTAATLLVTVFLAGSAAADSGWTRTDISGSTITLQLIAGEYVPGTLYYTNTTWTRSTPDTTFTRGRGTNRFVSIDGAIEGRGGWHWRRTMGPGSARSFHQHYRIDYRKEGEGRIDTYVLRIGYKYNGQGELIYSYGP